MSLLPLFRTTALAATRLRASVWGRPAHAPLRRGAAHLDSPHADRAGIPGPRLRECQPGLAPLCSSDLAPTSRWGCGLLDVSAITENCSLAAIECRMTTATQGGQRRRRTRWPPRPWIRCSGTPKASPSGNLSGVGVVPDHLRSAIAAELSALERGERPDLLVWVHRYGERGATLVVQPDAIWTHRLLMLFGPTLANGMSSSRSGQPMRNRAISRPRSE
jgi:hypothetical protein